MQFRDNALPRGLIPLEEIFYFNDVARKPQMESTKANVEKFNIGSEKEPKMVKLSKTLPAPIK